MPTTFPLGSTVFFVDIDNPGATDDIATIGARQGHWWLNTSDSSVHICINSTASSAIWQEVTPNTRTITAGTGLTGGGTLDADRTISIASTAVSTGTYGSASLIPIFTVNAQGQLTNATTTAVNTTTLGAVPTSRTLTAGTGLTGGGDLSADRSFALTGNAEKFHSQTGGPGTGVLEVPRVSDLGTAAFADIYSVGGIFTVSQTSNYTVSLADFRKLIIATASTLTFTLPLAADVPYGWFCITKNRSGNGLTISRSGSDTLNSGLTSVSVASSSAVNYVVKTSNTNFEVT